MKDLRKIAGTMPPFLCADGHEPIGYWKETDGDLCPLCAAHSKIEDMGYEILEVMERHE